MNRLNTLPDEIIEKIYFINHKRQMNRIMKLLDHPSISYKSNHTDGFSWSKIAKCLRTYEGVIAHTFID